MSIVKKNFLKLIGAVALINLISRLLGFIREVIIGYHFGTSFLADSVITAYTIPNLLYIVAGGAITTAFISIYNKSQNAEIQNEIREAIFTYTLILFSLISVVFVLFPSWWTSLFFSGLDDNQLELTSELFQIMAPSTLFLVLSMFYSGILNVNNKFQVTAVAPLVNNFLFIFVAVLLYPLIHAKAYGWGALIGAIVMVVILVMNMRRQGISPFKLRFVVHNRDYMIRFLKISIPILLGGATLQFYFLIHRIFASSLEAGYIAALNYSSKLIQLPQTILMGAVTTVIYPLIARLISEGKQKELSKLYSGGIYYLLFLMIPSTVFIYFYADEIVKVIFEYGSFDHRSSAMTSSLLKVSVIGMFAHSANLYVTRFFYAMEKALTPVVSGFLAVFGVNVLIIVLFLDEFGANTIAWATTISAYFQLAVLLIAGRKTLKLEFGSRTNLIKQAFLGLVLIVLASAFKKWIPVQASFISLIVGFLFVCLCTLFLAYIFKIEEIQKLVSIKGKRKGGN